MPACAPDPRISVSTHPASLPAYLPSAGELMRIAMLAEVARTAATVTDRATLLCLLDKAFAA